MSEMEDPKVPTTDEYLMLLLMEQMRIYDVLMALLMNSDGEAAAKLFELHENHDTWGPLPFKVVE